LTSFPFPTAFRKESPPIRWKRLGKGVISNANKKEIRESSESLKKMKNNIEDSENLKINYKGDPTFITKFLWKCKDCMVSCL
jgi:hypothetical protein